MYKAIHVETGGEIIILHPAWLKRIEQLREMDRADLLVCQGCRQPLRVKAGELKRPHFAHKHLRACSLGSETPEILNARAVLYDWLHRRFGDALTLEKQVESLPRPVDCWVETPRGVLAYWIIEAGIKLEPRKAILDAFDQMGVKVTYIFLAAMLNEEKKEFHSLLLTPTERAFMQPTPYDEFLAGAGEVGKSMHYLDADAARLTTFHGLRLHHRPNWFKGLKKTAALDEISAGPEGGFIYPGEAVRLGKFYQKKQRLENKRRSYAERRAYAERRQDPASQADLPQRLDPLPPSAPRERWGTGAPPDDAGQAAPEELPCVTCGQITLDYWSTFYDAAGRKLCRCRECLARENQ
jgi:hypothetical protein